MDENKMDNQLEELMEQKEPELVLPGDENVAPAVQETTEAEDPQAPEEPAVAEDVVQTETARSAPEEGVGAEDAPEPEPVPEPEPEPEPGLLGGDITQLRMIKEAIADLAQSEQECKDTEKYLKGKTKELEIQKKRVEEKVTASVKKARADLEKGYDEEISSIEKALKDAEIRKKNAKAAAVNERMKRENSSLVDDNKVLKAEIKSRFRDASVPSICRSSLYYSLFSPKRLVDFLICIAAILIFAGLIPFAVTQLVNGMVYKILIWVLIVVFFAAIYFLIAFWTKKGGRNDAIAEMRSKVNQIRDNKKTIKSRNKNIRMDPDESQYNLYEYDQELESARADLEKTKTDREQALDHFEQEDSVRIREDLEREKAPVFEQMEKEIAALEEDYKQKEAHYQEAQRVMDAYNAELNEKGWKADKVDELIKIMEEGKASTIREAMNVQKNK